MTVAYQDVVNLRIGFGVIIVEGAVGRVHGVKEIAAGQGSFQLVNGGAESFQDVVVEEIAVTEIAGVKPAERGDIADEVGDDADGDIFDGVDGAGAQGAVGGRLDKNILGVTIAISGGSADLDLIGLVGNSGPGDGK